MTVAQGTTVLHVDALRLRRGPREVLRGVSLRVAAGEIVALMGVSGAGKSTILRAAVALEAFHEGQITVGDATLRPGPVPRESQLRALRRQVGMVFQQHALFTHLSVRDNITLAPIHAARVAPEAAAREAMRLLELLGVAHRADAFPSQISGGEAQRVAIARALALDPPVLLMDEPTAALDPARRGALADSLRALAQAGRGLLVTTHDLAFAKDADRVVVLADGNVVEEGPARTVLEAPQHAATRALLED
ncbi:MAG: ATP-binding cassette domain-containing protein [Gemmatimonadaceae bacterium]|nr:ATP-binding cassette domain-containing protein [Gemmatimonadaceae bacterium]